MEMRFLKGQMLPTSDTISAFFFSLVPKS